ncbi:two-component system, NtrC family, sensor kinase [Humidesulfovibrio mexicanus]|uniref:histidine kinase n=1 Tax=Humidesulfovibrio mexicanus TaxID=147047 RepID=A0A238ZA88_9BACT|nr:PAS domain-containing sensor histidine kinase [Humidesulfovibrio mexicanus]SNR79992.1 two-component system, NtrC family, sensor kinase [Humidesulfovibrio mexicanus]
MIEGSGYTKLRIKMVLTTLGFSLIPLLILGYAIFRQFESAHIGKVVQHLSHLTENKRRTIDLFLNERLSQLMAIAYTHKLQYFLEEGTLERVFTLMQARSKYYIDLGVIDQDGDHVVYTGPYRAIRTANYKDEDWFNQVSAKGFYISDVFLGRRNYPHFIIAVSRREGDRTWILRATIDSDIFDSLVQSDQLGTNGDAFLLNADNVLQSKPRFGPKLLQRVDFGSFPKFSGVRTESINVDGKPFLVGLAWLENKNWLLAIRDDPSEELMPLARTRSMVWLLLAGGFLLIAGGTILTSNTILGQLMQAEREKAALNASLTQSSKLASLGKMAAGVAHEINNPLAIIKEEAGWMRDLLAEEDIKASPNFKEYEGALAKIEQHVTRAKDVTHRLLGFARRMDPIHEDVNINEVINQTITFLQNEARYRGIEIHTGFQKNLPFVASDSSQLQQVFLNIIDNAIDAIGKDGHIHIRTMAVHDPEEVIITIKDSGPGIPKEKLDKIFDPFFTTKKVGEGTGLGLTISFSIVQKLGGRITVESEEGHGATFIIGLPLNKD